MAIQSEQMIIVENGNGDFAVEEIFFDGKNANPVKLLHLGDGRSH